MGLGILSVIAGLAADRTPWRARSPAIIGATA